MRDTSFIIYNEIIYLQNYYYTFLNNQKDTFKNNNKKKKRLSI